MSLFFFFSKIFTILIFPLPFCIFLGFLIVLFKIKGIKNKFYAFLPIGIIWLASSFIVCDNLMQSLENDFPPVAIENVKEADVIIILGGMINTLTKYPERVEIMESSDRLTDGFLLYKAKKAKYVLYSGGSGVLFEQTLKEADFAQKFLLSLGIPENQLLLERESKNTFENALFSKKILEEKNLKRVILVTSAFHMKRSLGIFEKLGIQVTPFPTDYQTLRKGFDWEVFIPSHDALRTTTIAIKEWVGLWVYNWKGYL